MAGKQLVPHPTEGFILEHEADFPPLLHNNSSLRETVDICRRWGCKMKQASGNDIIVSHPLSTIDGASGFARASIPLSATRGETSRALVSYIRTVKEATLRHIAQVNGKASSVHEPKPRFDFIPTAKKDPVPTPEKLVVAPVPAPMAEPAKAPVSVGPAVGEEVVRLMGEAAVRLRTAMDYTHYREHCTPGQVSAASKCSDQACKSSLAAIQCLTTAEGMVRAETARVDGRINDLEIEVNRLLEELTKPAVIPAAPVIEQIQPAAREPAGKELTEDDLARAACLKAFDLFHNRVMPHWPEGRTAARVMLAIRTLMERGRYHESWVGRFKNLDFTGLRMSLCEICPPGRTNRLMGPGGWRDLNEACQHAKKGH